MKWLTAILLLLLPSGAFAQCNGVFGASQACGSVAGGPPGPIPFSSIAGGLVIGATPITSGTNTRVLYDNSGVLGEYTNTQLTALINTATASLSGALPAWPNNTTTYFRGDGTYATLNFAAIGSTPTTLAGYGITNARTQLTSATTYFVNGNSGGTATCGVTGGSTCQAGSDSNTGLSVSSPWLTVQHACDFINQKVDLAAQTVIVNLAHAAASSASAANYGGAQCKSGAWVGQVEITIQGDTASPTAVHITAPNSGDGLFVKDLALVAIDSVQIDDAGSAVSAIHAGQLGIIDVSNVTFGAFNSGAVHLYSESGGAKINVLAGNSIAGGAGQFIDVQNNSVLSFNNQTVAIPVAKAFTTFAFIAGSSSVAGLSNTTFTGSGVAATTGVRAIMAGSTYVAAAGNSCNVVFPGNSPCQISNSASDDANDPLTQPILAASFISLATTAQLATSTLTPTVQYHTITPATVSPFGLFSWANVTNGTRFELFKSRGATVGTYTAVTSGDQIGVMAFDGADGTNGVTGAHVRATVDGSVSTGIVPMRLEFRTMNSGGTLDTRFTVFNDGGINTGTGTTSPGVGVFNISAVGSAAAPTLTVGNTTTGLYSVSTTGLGLSVNGTVEGDWGITNSAAWTLVGNVFAPNLASLSGATTSWVCWTTSTGAVSRDSASCITSLRKLKKDIEPLARATAELTSLKPSTFLWKQPADVNQQGPQFGFIAEDVDAVDHKLASYSDDGKLHGWRQDSMIALLVKGFQEQQAELDNLKRRLH